MTADETLSVIGLLVTVIGWFLIRTMSTLDKTVKESRETKTGLALLKQEAALKNERLEEKLDELKDTIKDLISVMRQHNLNK